MDPYDYFGKRQGPAPLPQSDSFKDEILNDQTGAMYAGWRAMYFVINYPTERKLP